MKYFKIEKDNRYYNLLKSLKSIIQIEQFFEKRFDDDKARWYTNYHEPKSNFKNVVINCKELVSKVQNEFDKNLTTKEEKGLLIFNLLLFVTDYGYNNLREMLMYQKGKEDIFQEYNIKSISDINEQMIIEQVDKFELSYSGNIKLILNYRECLIREFEFLEIEFSNEISPDKIKTETEQKTQTFTNNFDKITPTEIYKHFKAGLVEKGYLTEQELNEYLKAAFELQTKPEILFKLKHTPTKQKIYTVFYIYYKDISQKKHGRQKEYAALLGDFFEGYKTEIIQTNWARDYKTKR